VSQPVIPTFGTNSQHRAIEGEIHARMQEVLRMMTAVHGPSPRSLRPAFAAWYLRERGKAVIIEESVTICPAAAA
jgi:hypothetical protein